MRLRKILSKFPLIGKYITRYPPGHYYSPIPSKEDVSSRIKEIYSEKEIRDINFNTEYQLKYLEKCKVYMENFSNRYKDTIDGKNRYHLDNGFFDYIDASFLNNAMLYFRPKRYFEIGSGYSTSLSIDIDENLLSDNIQYLLVDPYPKRLLDLLKPEDFESKDIKLKKEIVQNIDYNIFKNLEPNDFLFIDSTHITKIGSDVNYIFFEILPILKSGVVIHIHDIFFPFEYYPKRFLQDSITFNELYILRAFLMNNDDYEIISWPSYLLSTQSTWFQNNAPEVYAYHQKDEEGPGSIWLRKK